MSNISQPNSESIISDEVTQYTLKVADIFNAAVGMGAKFNTSRAIYPTDETQMLAELSDMTKHTPSFIKAAMTCAADPEKAAEIAEALPVHKMNVVEVARLMTLQEVQS